LEIRIRQAQPWVLLRIKMNPKNLSDPEVAKKELLVLHEMRGRYDAMKGSAQPLSPEQRLLLAEARFLAVSILLEIEPTILGPWLDKLAWQADLKEETWNAARNEAGVPIPPVSVLNSAIRTSLPTLSKLLAGAEPGRPAVLEARDPGFGPQVHPWDPIRTTHRK